MSTLNIDDEWSKFILSSSTASDDEDVETVAEPTVSPMVDTVAPDATPIYISTKSKIAYLNSPIDLNIFWNIPQQNFL